MFSSRRNEPKTDKSKKGSGEIQNHEFDSTLEQNMQPMPVTDAHYKCSLRYECALRFKGGHHIMNVHDVTTVHTIPRGLRKEPARGCP